MAIFLPLKKLSLWQQTAFCAGLLERMLPNYQMFSEAAEFGDSALLRMQLDLIWQRLSGAKVKINLEAQLAKLDEQVPDPEQFDLFGVYPALDCTMALMALLQALQDKESEGFAEVGKLSYNSVRHYLELALAEQFESQTDVEQLEQAIVEHPLMQWEVAMQNELFDLLKTAPENQQTCSKVKALVLEEGLSNLGIECV